MQIFIRRFEAEPGKISYMLADVLTYSAVSFKCVVTKANLSILLLLNCSEKEFVVSFCLNMPYILFEMMNVINV